MDVDSASVNNLQEVSEQQVELDFDVEIGNEPEVSGGIHDYILVRDRSVVQPSHQKDMSMKTLQSMHFLLVLETLLLFERLNLARRKISGWAQWWMRYSP